MAKRASAQVVRGPAVGERPGAVGGQGLLRLLVVAALAVGALVAGGGAPAGAQLPGSDDDREPERVVLATAMSGEARGVVVRATSSLRSGVFGVVLEVSNTTDEPAELEVPAGTVLATDDETQQALVVAGPTASLASVGGDGGTTVTVPPGRSTHELLAFCGQRVDVGPTEPTPLHHAGTALAPLPRVLANIAEAPQLDPVAAQDAVWWVTDDPSLPVRPEIAPLLDGVDTTSFAADPVQVVPDPGYAPVWSGGELGALGGAGDGSGLPGPGDAGGLAWLVLVAVAGLGGLALLARRSRPDGPVEGLAGPGGGPGGGPSGAWPPAAAVRVAPAASPPGWYADPHGVALVRWWDGTRWTEHVSDR